VKILAISDEEIPALWEQYAPGRLKDYDLIISCGDLKADYLSFLVTMARCPVLYVHGNHDGCYSENPPEGCDCIDDQIVVYRGLRILGLGGCRWYHKGPYQFTEAQMRRRIRRLRFALWKTGGVDIVVTHAPPWGIGDDEDPAHHGFQALIELLDKYHPKYLIHGHVHLRYGQSCIREHEYNGSHIINVCPRHTLEVPDREYDLKDSYNLIWKTRHRD
jgi:predicted phosphodiesterase